MGEGWGHFATLPSVRIHISCLCIVERHLARHLAIHFHGIAEDGVVLVMGREGSGARAAAAAAGGGTNYLEEISLRLSCAAPFGTDS